MIITHKLEMDLAKQGVTQRIDAMQNDAYTRVVELSLYRNGEEWSPPDGVSVAVSYIKPDGTSGLYDTLPGGASAATIDGNVVSVRLAPQMFTAHGLVRAAVIMDREADRLSTFPFGIVVAENPGAGAVKSENYYHYTTFDALNAAIGDLADLETEAKSSLVAAINEAAKSGGSSDGSQNSAAGFSPAATVKQTPDGAVITITDANGTTTATVYNGKDSVGEAEIILPSEAVAIVGVEFNIYHNSVILSNRPLDSFDIRWSISDTSVSLERFSECLRITATDDNIGNHTITAQVKDLKSGAVIAEKAMTLHIIANKTVAGKNVLYIGDSLTFSRGGLYAAEIQHNLSNGGMLSVGTQTGAQSINSIGEVKHEGYNGAAVGGFLSANVTSGYTNPFYNPTTGLFDLSYYMTQQGNSKLDAVCLNLGHNNIGNHVNAVSGLKTIIGKIHEYDPNLPIIVSLITPVGDQNAHRGSTFTAAQMRAHWRNLISSYIEAFDNGAMSNVFLSTPYFCIDADHDFPTETVARSARDATEIVRQTDSMHPNRVATLKMADVYYAYLLYHIPEDGTVYYNVTNNLTNVTNSNSAAKVKSGDAYTATLTAAIGYTLDSVSVTMGGTAVPVTDGVISIESVTGDIVITASAVEAATVDNLVDPSTANDASPDTTTLFKDEWINGYYLSSSSLSANTGCIVTDLFPVSHGQKIKVEGILLSSLENKNRFRWYLFDADGERIYGSYVNFATNEPPTYSVSDCLAIDTDNNTATIDTSLLSTAVFENLAYARFSCYPANGNSKLIVTKI